MAAEPLSLLVCEYLSAGGRVEPEISGAGDDDATDDLAAEGEAMLRALLEDLRGEAISGMHVAALVAPGFPPPWPAGIDRIECRDDPATAVARELAARGRGRRPCLWAIAPETRGILEELARTAERAGAALAGSPSGAIARAADRAGLLERLADAGVSVPEGGPAASPREARRRAGRLGGAVVVKPGRGAGGAGTTRVGAGEDLEGAWRAARAAEPDLPPLVQRHVEGLHASVTVLAGEGEARPLGLFRQRVRFTPAVRYDGPPVPLRHPRARDAFRAAVRAVRTCGGLRGPVGVDLVLTARGPVVLEINPRLTTAWPALRRRSGRGHAAAALRASGVRRASDLPSSDLPSPVSFRG